MLLSLNRLPSLPPLQRLISDISAIAAEAPIAADTPNAAIAKETLIAVISTVESLSLQRQTVIWQYSALRQNTPKYLKKYNKIDTNGRKTLSCAPGKKSVPCAEHIRRSMHGFHTWVQRLASMRAAMPLPSYCAADHVVVPTDFSYVNPVKYRCLLVVYRLFQTNLSISHMHDLQVVFTGALDSCIWAFL